MAMSRIVQNRTAQQQSSPLNIGLGTSINGQPNYDIGMTIDPSMSDRARGLMQGLMGGGGGGGVGGGGGGFGGGGATATTQNVKDEQLMSHQLNQLLAEGSPYIDQARRGAMETHAGRGMLNTSMAAGAGEREAIQAGVPIAGFDAQRFGSVADQNMAAQNAVEMANLQSRTQMGAANASAAASRANAESARQAALQQMYLGHEFGAMDDYRRHMLGMETREDTQAFQAGQADIDRHLQDRQFGASMGLDYARLGETARQADQNLWGNVNQGLMQIGNNIFANPDMSAQQQTSAWQNMINNIGPSMGQGSLGMIPPHLMNQVAGPQASNAVSRMPPIRI